MSKGVKIHIQYKIVILLKFFVWEFPKFMIIKWIEICKWYKEQAQFEKKIKENVMITEQKLNNEVKHRTDEQLWTMFECLGYQDKYRFVLKDRVEKELSQRGLFNIYRGDR